MNKQELLGHLARLDHALASEAVLCIYGSAVCILLDEPDRTSLDIDVAAPYSRVDFVDLVHAAGLAGLPVNPPDDIQADHLEWISAVRLCLPRPDPTTELVLWQGRRLSIKTVSLPELVASKLIRYDPIDQGDVQYLCAQAKVGFAQVESAVSRLPPPFHQDPLVLENLENLRRDLTLWRKAER
jgi:hypothetical protein